MGLNKELLERIINDAEVCSRETVADKYDIGIRSASYYWFISQNIGTLSEFFETDDELVEQNVRFQKQKQKFQDFNRIERKSFREYARVENAVSEYAQALIKVCEDNPYKAVGVKHKSADNAVGILHITDTHFNELINLTNNKYDFTIANKRIHKLIKESTKYFKLHGISDVFVMMTGDLLNSDRRLDELVSMSTNRAKASFIGVQILENAMVDLNTEFNVHIAGVVGNESRMSKDINWSNQIVSDNYDFTMFNMLRYKLKYTKGISFLGLSDKHEEVVAVGDKNFLLIHGHQIGKDTAKDIAKLTRKYADKRIVINYVLYGHIHETLISDTFSRGSSMCGANNYSEDALQLVSRASQNIHISFEGNRIDSVKIDLQDTDGYAGYDTHDWMDAYNPKSVDKAHKIETILRITI